MENPALGGASECQLAGDTKKHTAPRYNLQVTLERAFRHEWRAEWLGSILALRLDRPRCLVLAAGALHALDPDLREDVCETVLGDLRAGPPVPRFNSVKAEAELWASYASPLEVKHYLVACWNVLPAEDRQRFWRAAL